MTTGPDKIFFSVVVPTYLRVDEVQELLESLVNQSYPYFEVIIADGSPDDSVGKVVAPFRDRLKIIYLYQEKLGISESRNWGVENANGDYVVFFDSDCVIPPDYFTTTAEYLDQHNVDAYGGPDRAGENFNFRQKAISYAMTSLFTTGGIRGGKTHAGQYQPRSFNMGIRREVFNVLGGFSRLKVSEDIDLSMRLYAGDYRVVLIGSAYVYHKRRSTYYKFFRQVFSFGSGRVDLQVRYGNALKWVHLLPALFTLYLVSGLLWWFVGKTLFFAWLLTLLVYFAAILLDSTIQNRNLWVGLSSAYAASVMLIGYGMGMIKALVLRGIFRSRKESEKPEITKI